MKGPYETGRFAYVSHLDQVDSSDELARIVGEMHADLVAHPDEWENATLERFLEALSATLDALPATVPTWETFAESLVKASGYE